MDGPKDGFYLIQANLSKRRQQGGGRGVTLAGIVDKTIIELF